MKVKGSLHLVCSEFSKSAWENQPIMMTVPFTVAGNASHLFESVFADVLLRLIPGREATSWLLHHVLLYSLCVALGTPNHTWAFTRWKTEFYYVTFLLYLFHNTHGIMLILKIDVFSWLGFPLEADPERKIYVQILNLEEKQEALAESREWESEGKATKSHIFKQVSSVGSWGSFLLGGSRRPRRTCLGVVPSEGWEELGYLSSTSTSGWLRTAPGTLTPPHFLRASWPDWEKALRQSHRKGVCWRMLWVGIYWDDEFLEDVSGALIPSASCLWVSYTTCRCHLSRVKRALQNIYYKKGMLGLIELRTIGLS